MFKNMIVFQLAQAFGRSPGMLEEILRQRPMQPCSGLSMQSRGFVPVAEGHGFVENHERHLLLAVGIEEKKLPASTVRRAVAERAAALEKTQGYKPGKKQLRELKERVVTEMIPGVPAKYSELKVWIDGTNQRVIVDASSSAKAEMVLEFMRESFDGTFPVMRPEPESPIDAQLTDWLLREEAPEGFELDTECELADPNEGGAQVKYKASNLRDKDVREHLERGKRCTKLSVVNRSDLVLVLTKKLEIKGVKSLAMSEEKETEGDEFVANFTLVADRYSSLISDLFKALKVAAPAAQPVAGGAGRGAPVPSQGRFSSAVEVDESPEEEGELAAA